MRASQRPSRTHAAARRAPGRGLRASIHREASGAVAERPELARALDHLRPGDTLVVWKLDRLGRSLRHLIDTVRGLKTAALAFAACNGVLVGVVEPAGGLQPLGAMTVGRSPRRPRARAAASPAWVRSRIRSRSNSANAPKDMEDQAPARVVVDVLLCRLPEAGGSVVERPVAAGSADAEGRVRWYQAHGTDAGADAGVTGVTVVRADRETWCLQTATAHEFGPNGTPAAGPWDQRK